LTYYHVIVTRVRDNLGLSEARALAHAAGLLTAQSWLRWFHVPWWLVEALGVYMWKRRRLSSGVTYHGTSWRKVVVTTWLQSFLPEMRTWTLGSLPRAQPRDLPKPYLIERKGKRKDENRVWVSSITIATMRQTCALIEFGLCIHSCSRLYEPWAQNKYSCRSCITKYRASPSLPSRL